MLFLVNVKNLSLISDALPLVRNTRMEVLRFHLPSDGLSTKS